MYQTWSPSLEAFRWVGDQTRPTYSDHPSDHCQVEGSGGGGTPGIKACLSWCLRELVLSLQRGEVLQAEGAACVECHEFRN